jgi:hypothetical protein
MAERDDFSAGVKDALAKRVGFRCSNPGCKQLTSGPQQESPGAVNIGVAAHITAASEGGPRFNPNLTSEQRSSIANGVWLCQNCAKLVDNDEAAYPVDRIVEWKNAAESAATDELERRRSPDTSAQAVFMEATRVMPDLINEMRDDLAQDTSGLAREFVTLPNRNCSWNHAKPTFTYYLSDHPHLLLQIDWLVEMGLVTVVQYGDSPIYRITPSFASELRGSTA